MPEYTEKAVSGKLSVRKGDKQNEPEKRKLLAFRCACRKSYMAHGNSNDAWNVSEHYLQYYRYILHRQILLQLCGCHLYLVC